MERKPRSALADSGHTKCRGSGTNVAFRSTAYTSILGVNDARSVSHVPRKAKLAFSRG